MALLLRKIRRDRWERPENGDSWIPANDIHADPLGELATHGGKLSVWVIDTTLSNLNRVLTALAAKCDRIANVDFILFDEELANELGVPSESSLGDTPDKVANETWHRDLVELTVSRAVNLAKRLYHDGKKDRRDGKAVGSLLCTAVAQDWIDRGRMKERLRNKVEKRIAQETQGSA